MNLSSWSIENYLANYYAFNTLSLDQIVDKHNCNKNFFTKKENLNYNSTNLNLNLSSITSGGLSGTGNNINSSNLTNQGLIKSSLNNRKNDKAILFNREEGKLIIKNIIFLI